MTTNDAIYAGMDPAESGHDLDLTNVKEAPDVQGYYDNGRQPCLIWCGIHKQYEWQWVVVPGNIVPAVLAIRPMDLKRALAINLRRTRHAKELTQEELADRAGLSTRYLGSIERGAVSASVTVLGQLAQALRVDPCELIHAPYRR
jgi:DNA-binding XRE family transcriptional regulator